MMGGIAQCRQMISRKTNYRVSAGVVSGPDRTTRTIHRDRIVVKTGRKRRSRFRCLKLGHYASSPGVRVDTCPAG